MASLTGLLGALGRSRLTTPRFFPLPLTLSEGHYQRHLTRLRARLGEATANAVTLFEAVGAEIFARNAQTLFVWAALPGVADSLVLAQALLPQKIMMASGRIFSVDSSGISPWSRSM